jgi:hypothetical protein
VLHRGIELDDGDGVADLDAAVEDTPIAMRPT